MRNGVERKRRPQVAADTLERPEVTRGHTHSHLPAKQRHKHELYQNIRCCIYYLFSIYLKRRNHKIFISEDFSISYLFLRS
jgi:hypothetical protein